MKLINMVSRQTGRTNALLELMARDANAVFITHNAAHAQMLHRVKPDWRHRIISINQKRTLLSRNTIVPIYDHFTTEVLDAEADDLKADIRLLRDALRQIRDGHYSPGVVAHEALTMTAKWEQ